jgi:2-polyprenyl-3-methyl-5-hydroxy-6-metoxy-1,4-benzoquinol methylase
MKQKIVENLLELSKNSYDKIAADFDITRKKEIWPEIRTFANQVKNGDRVLDAGCGNGRLLEALENKNIDYLGIDNSRSLLNLAKKNYPKNKFLELDLAGNNLNINTLGTLGNKKFNAIFCLAVLQHIPGKDLKIQILKSMRLLLENDGVIVISNWNLWSSRHKSLIIKQIFYKLIGLNKKDFGDIIFPWKNKHGETISNRYYHAFTRRELLYLAKKADFKNITIRSEKYNYWLILS